MDYIRGLFARVLALEFDRVLTTDLVVDLRNDQEALESFGGMDRVEHLQKFLTSMRQNGALVVVISRNEADVIYSCLQGVGLEVMIDRVFDRHTLQTRLLGGKPSKAVMMNEILTQVGVGSSCAIFVDEPNSRESSRGMPCAKHAVKGTKGLNLDDMRSICQSLRVPFTITAAPPEGLSLAAERSDLAVDGKDDAGIELTPTRRTQLPMASIVT